LKVSGGLVHKIQANVNVKTYMVQVFRDGKNIGVCFGNSFADGMSGFGSDLPSALEDLARDFRAETFEDESHERYQLREELFGVSRPPVRKMGKVLAFPAPRQ